MKCAVIDIGSNSVLLTVSDDEGRIILDLDRVTKLGEGLGESSYLRPEAMERTVNATCKFYKLAIEHGAEKIIAVGTMALRMAKNRDVFLLKVKEKCGLNIKVLSGKEEAQLSFEAAISSLQIQKQNIEVFDVGGKSTEIIVGENGNPAYLKSINLGALTLLETSKIDFRKPVSEDQLKKLEKLTMNILSKSFPLLDAEVIVGIGGTVTNLAAIKLGLREYDRNKVHGLKVQVNEIINILKILASQPIEYRKIIAGLQPERAELIIPGLIIVLSILRLSGINELIVSDRGFRHAILKSCQESSSSK